MIHIFWLYLILLVAKMQICNTLENLVICFIFKFPHGVSYISEAFWNTHIYVFIHTHIYTDQANTSVCLYLCLRERKKDLWVILTFCCNLDSVGTTKPC